MKLRRPSPALVISCIALIVACAGTAYAKTLITSSSQIKNGIVTSGDVKNGSLLGSDLKDGTITSNKLKTPPAAGGPSTAYQVIRKLGPQQAPANQVIKVASMTVPAGAYKVTASTVLTTNLGPQGLLDPLPGVGGRCRLDAAGDATESLNNVVGERRTMPATFYMQNTRTIGTPGEFFLECSAGSPFTLSETSIIATKVSDIVQTTAAP
ncbi:MAG: hypothetical protein QOI64_1217 [Solirubrobacteraceae bacterium]|jgi:hypothetical protein|nr:hypothetical protein [Solirubrobacteraceae bacterium]